MCVAHDDDGRGGDKKLMMNCRLIADGECVGDGRVGYGWGDGRRADYYADETRRTSTERASICLKSLPEHEGRRYFCWEVTNGVDY